MMRAVFFRRSIRLLLVFSALLAVALLCLLLTSRWWLPPVLPPLAAKWGVELASAERAEGGRLRLSGLVMALGEASLRVDQVELPFEWRYLRECFVGEWSAASTVRVGWVRVLSGPNEAAAPSPGSGQVFLPQLRQQLFESLAVADPWLPRIEVAEVEYLDAGQAIVFAEDILYEARRLSGQIGLASSRPEGVGRAPVDRIGRTPAHAYAKLRPCMPSGPWRVAVSLPEVGPWLVDFSEVDWGLAGSLELSGFEEAVFLEVRLARSHTQSQAELTARFGAAAWLPEEARLSSDGFDFSGLPLPQSDDFTLAALKLEKVQAHWDGAAYRFESVGRGLLQGREEMRQTVAFELSGRGDLEGLQVEVAQVISPWAKLRLSESLGIDFKQRQFTGAAFMRAEVDLEQFPWLQAEGQVEAELRVEAADLDRLHFQLQGEELGYADIRARQMIAKGWVDLETLRLEDLSFIPAGAANDEKLEISGTVDWQAKALNFDYRARLGADWLNHISGQELLLSALEIEAGEVRGPWAGPDVRAKLRTSLQADATEAIELGAEVHWNGRNRLDWSGEAHSQGAAIEAAGQLLREETAWALLLASLRWSDPDRPDLRLEKPASLRWSQAGVSLEERVSIAGLSLRGEDLALSLNYAFGEGLSVQMEEFSLARLQPWLRADIPLYQVDSLVCELSQLRPFLAGHIRIAAEERIDAGASARLELSADLGEETLALRKLRLHFSGEELLQGAFELPLQLHLPFTSESKTELTQTFYTLGEGAVSGEFRGRSSPGFVDWLQRRTNLRIADVSLDVALKGNLKEPIGQVRLEAAQLEIGPAWLDAPLPPVEALNLAVHLDAKRIDVENLSFSINQSPVRATLAMPVEALQAQLAAETFDPVRLLDSATAEMQVASWKMENWLDLLPSYFRQSGEIRGSLSLAPKMQLTGQLAFEDFGLRPTATMASIDQIAGQLRLEDRRLIVDQASARFGGSRLALKGEMNFTDFARPRWFLEAKGANLPLLRTTEMILRSDVDLRFDALDPDLPPLMAGNLNLQSSTLLLDFDPLAPRLERGTMARPPFFSISEAPFADWRFNVKAFGDRFMRVRSPYFRARFSADFELSGTFAEPLLLGSVRTSDAELHFPGAKFLIDEGEALIEASRPNEMQLAFNGIAQKSSKVIMMEVSQTMADPLIHFEATPAMSQVEIVRLLATGSASGGGVGNLGLYLGKGMLGPGGLNESLSDKLTLDVGAQTSRSGQKTIDARYQLSPRWSVEGGYDVFDAYNADLIWTIFKR